MTTTFTSRELIVDELVALFVANGSWSEVYGYLPSLETIQGQTPILIVRGRGTRQQMTGLDTNPASYRILISSWVRATATNWTSAQAEDKLHDLDRVIRQVIRNANGALTNANSVEFEDGFSQVDDIPVNNIPYMIESRAVIAHLYRGA